MTSISEKAAILHRSARTQQPTAQFSTTEEYDLESAYKVQHELIKQRVDEGHEIVGVKISWAFCFVEHISCKYLFQYL